MHQERRGFLKFKNKDVTLISGELKPGDKAPEFLVQTQDWTDLYGLDGTRGKVRIIAAVPSLETEVCDRETRRFNQEATSIGEDIIVLVISMDLPYSQKRWCGAAGIDRVTVLSDHMSADFGTKYGCLIKEARILHRSVFVIDGNDTVVYAAYMPALGVEPEYEEVLSAARQALQQGGTR